MIIDIIGMTIIFYLLISQLHSNRKKSFDELRAKALEKELNRKVDVYNGDILEEHDDGSWTLYRKLDNDIMFIEHVISKSQLNFIQ